MKIIPIKDLRNTSEISRMCHESDGPIFISKNGYGDLVIMSITTYNNMFSMGSIDTARIDSDIENNEKTGHDEMPETDESCKELENS